MVHKNLLEIRKLFASVKEQFHKHPLIKFLAVFLIFFVYLIFSIHNFGAKDGLLISLLTWTFFVLCTPVADAGFLLDLPVRLITGFRMVYSEIVVWIVAIVVNFVLFFSNPSLYESSHLLSLFHHILSQPFPFWLIIILSGGGTFLSLIFGDELLDISYEHKDEREHHKKHKRKHHLIIIITLLVLLFILYDFLLYKLGVDIPLF